MGIKTPSPYRAILAMADNIQKVFPDAVLEDDCWWPANIRGAPVWARRPDVRVSHTERGTTFDRALLQAMIMKDNDCGHGYVCYAPKIWHDRTVVDVDTAKIADDNPARDQIIDAHKRLIESFSDSYIELSQSGISHHIIVGGSSEPSHIGKRINSQLHLEWFISSGYVVLTGNMIEGGTTNVAPIGPQDAEQFSTFFPAFDMTASGPREDGTDDPMDPEELRVRMRNTAGPNNDYPYQKMIDGTGAYVPDHNVSADRVRFIQWAATITTGRRDQAETIWEVLSTSWFALKHAPSASGSNPDRFTNPRKIAQMLEPHKGELDKWIRITAQEVAQQRADADAARTTGAAGVAAVKAAAQDNDSPSSQPPAPPVGKPAPPPPVPDYTSAVAAIKREKGLVEEEGMPALAALPDTPLHNMIYAACKDACSTNDAEHVLIMTTHLVVGILTSIAYDLDGTSLAPNTILGGGTGAGKAFAVDVIRQLFDPPAEVVMAGDDKTHKIVLYSMLKSAEGIRDLAGEHRYGILALEEGEAAILGLDPACKGKFEGTDKYVNGLSDGKSMRAAKGATMVNKLGKEVDDEKLTARPRGALYFATQLKSLRNALTEPVFEKGAGGRFTFVLFPSRPVWKRDIYFIPAKFKPPHELTSLVELLLTKLDQKHLGNITTGFNPESESDGPDVKAKVSLYKSHGNMPAMLKGVFGRAAQLVMRNAAYCAFGDNVLNLLKPNPTVTNTFTLGVLSEITLGKKDYEYGISVVGASFDALIWMKKKHGLGEQSEEDKRRIIVEAIIRTVESQAAKSLSTVPMGRVKQLAAKYKGADKLQSIGLVFSEMLDENVGALVTNEKRTDSYLMTPKTLEWLKNELNVLTS